MTMTKWLELWVTSDIKKKKQHQTLYRLFVWCDYFNHHGLFRVKIRRWTGMFLDEITQSTINFWIDKMPRKHEDNIHSLYLISVNKMINIII